MKRIIIIAFLGGVLLAFPAGEIFADSRSPMPPEGYKKMKDRMTGEFLAPPVTDTSSFDARIPYRIRNITDGNSMLMYPEFSPDGKQIVFLSRTDLSEKIEKGEFWHNVPYSLNLWIMDSDGTNRRRLTSGEFYDLAPRFMPEGKKIIFVSTRRDGNWDLWSINTDGSGLARISDREFRDHYPSPSSDGKEVAFIIYKGAHGSVWLMDRDGGNIRRITSGGFGDDFPVINPRGDEIAFKSTRMGNGDIWTINREGKHYRRLTYEDYPEFYPSWSPDGTKIAYVTNKGGVFDVWVMNKDGSGKRKLTKNISGGNWGAKFDYDDLVETGYYHVSWHPDGTRIALTTLAEDRKNSYLSILEFDEDIVGAINRLPETKEPLRDYTLLGERELTGGDWEDFAPAFSPDGSTILFSSNRSGNWDIWKIRIPSDCGLTVVDCNLGEPEQLTKDPVDELAPVYSPDGTKIAFLSEIENPKSKIKNSVYSLWIMKSNGSDARQITNNVPVLSYPAWSPDGAEIALVTQGAADNPDQKSKIRDPEIWTYHLTTGDGRKVAAIWELGKSTPPISSFTEWGRKRTLTPSEINKLKQLFPSVRKKDAKIPASFKYGETKYIPYPLDEFLYRVDYNAAGDRLTFESNRSGEMHIWTIKKDGTDPVRVTKGEGHYWNPVYSPDSKKIAYARETFSVSSFNQPNYNIWVADAVTGEEMMITGEEQTDWNPAWSPDGKKMAYVTNRSGEFKHFSIWMLYLK